MVELSILVSLKVNLKWDGNHRPSIDRIIFGTLQDRCLQNTSLASTIVSATETSSKMSKLCQKWLKEYPVIVITSFYDIKRY